LTSYAQRAERQKELAIVKAQEKEMKEEKEAQRQVRKTIMGRSKVQLADYVVATHPDDQRQKGSKGGKGTL